MGLYLCVFASPDADDELDGVEVGGYDDFHDLRDAIATNLENASWGSRFPVLMSHSDSDGEISPADARRLEAELQTIAAELATFPARPFKPGSWQAQVAAAQGLTPTSLAGSFMDVDGEPLLPRLMDLAAVAVRTEQPISFQ